MSLPWPGRVLHADSGSIAKNTQGHGRSRGLFCFQEVDHEMGREGL